MTKRIKIDPEFQSYIPPLRDQERFGLEAALMEEGCRDPLVVWNDLLIDGHNRFEICERLGIEYSTTDIDLADRHAALAWIVDNQLNRRNLTAEQVRYYRGLQYNREKMSKAEAGALGGSSKGQNATCLPDTAERLAKEHGVSAATVKRDGKFAEKVENTPELREAVISGKSTAELKAEKKKRRQAELAAERAKLAESGRKRKGTRWHLECADIKNWDAPRSYDFIITDPPYPHEYLPLWNVLGERALDWLKPGGALIAMSGQSYLPDVIELLDRHLQYYWMGCYLLPGQPTSLRTRKVNTSWKPLLIYTLRNENYAGRGFGDVCTSEKPDKDHHVWGQSVSGMYDIVRRFCDPGQNILDPFAGSATTGVAALMHGCFFDGIDLDLEHVNLGKERLHDQET